MAPNNGNSNVKKQFQDLMNNRKKQKKNEDLAQQILGKGRHASNPIAGNNLAAGASFSSRMGVNKLRNSPKQRGLLAQVPSLKHQHIADMLEPDNGNSRSSALHTDSAAKLEREARLRARLLDSGGTITPTAGQLSIRGTAASGPAVVIASNFAPGTTAADIEFAMRNNGHQTTRCRVLSSHPTVVAEIECADRAGAENIIAGFNGAAADGNTLRVYLKHGDPTPTRTDRPVQKQPVVRQPSPPPPAPEPVADPAPEADDIMVVDTVGDRRGVFRREFGRLESHERSASGSHLDNRNSYGNEDRSYAGRSRGGGGYYRGGYSREPHSYQQRSYSGRY